MLMEEFESTEVALLFLRRRMRGYLRIAEGSVYMPTERKWSTMFGRDFGPVNQCSLR